MEKPTKVASAIALTFLLFIGGLVAIPFLAVAAAGDSPGCGASGPAEVEDDGTPSLLGPSTLTVANLRAWWTSNGRGQPTRLQMDIGDLIAVYLSEGDAEGVRGDMAFAQAVAETGYFTNSDTSINNFAGIAHYDGAASGAGFADPLIGVRAHIQLLKKYAGGNDVALANRFAATRRRPAAWRSLPDDLVATSAIRFDPVVRADACAWPPSHTVSRPRLSRAQESTRVPAEDLCGGGTVDLRRGVRVGRHRNPE